MLPYARTEPSKVSPFADGGNYRQWLLSGLIGVAALALIIDVHAGAMGASLSRLWLPAGAALSMTLLAAAYFRRRLAGYTGDCLGATQQLAELSFLITGLALVSRAAPTR
jgi:adenosylcobinamide-GDP ribazoletransferase